MSNFISAAKTLLSDESGITAIEYGFIAALVGVAISIGANVLGTSLSTLFNTLGEAITNALADGP